MDAQPDEDKFCLAPSGDEVSFIWMTTSLTLFQHGLKRLAYEKAETRTFWVAMMLLESFDRKIWSKSMEPIIRTGEPMVQTESEFRYN